MIVKRKDESIIDIQKGRRWDGDNQGIIIITDGRREQDNKIEYRIPVFNVLSDEHGELSAIQTDYIVHSDDGERKFNSRSIHIPKKVFERAKAETGLEWRDKGIKQL